MLLLTLLSLDWLVAGANILGVAFIGPAGLPAPELAHMLDSLVGVPRRIGRVWSSSVCRGTARNAVRDGNPDPESPRTQGTATNTSEKVHD